MDAKKCFCYLIPEVQDRLLALEDPKEYCMQREKRIRTQDEEMMARASVLLDDLAELKGEYEQEEDSRVREAYEERVEVLKNQKSEFDNLFVALYDRAREIFVDLPQLTASTDEQIIAGMELLCAALANAVQQ